VQPLIVHPDPLFNEKRALIEYTSEMHRNQRLFPITRMQFWRIVSKHARAAGLPKSKAHPHMLKHSCAMSLISKVGIENTRQWLGHRSMSSTGEYLKVSDEEAGRAVLASLNV
jgi:site-specific recombinase XerD